MSYPTEIDAVIVQIGNGATPEVFTTVCGMENVSLNVTVQTTDRFRRDCDKPGQIPTRAVRVTGKQHDFTGSGVANADEIERFLEVIGIRKNAKLIAIEYDGTDTGKQLGVFQTQGVITASNFNFSTNEGTSEMTFAGEDDLIWTPAA